MVSIITWGQWLGRDQCPYARRWILDARIGSLRVHHFLRSDDPRNYHDHPWWFVTFVVKGGYTDVSDAGRDHLKIGSIRFRSSHHAHYVDPDKGGVWTVLVTGPKTRTWGFWVNGKFKKAYRYFFDYGHPPCE